MPERFADRSAAGRALAGLLAGYARPGGRPGVLALALPRGGVPVAFEVAEALAAPLDLFLVRKLGVPGHEELAMGALATGGVRVLNPRVIRELAIPESAIEAAAAREAAELDRRDRLYRGDRPPPALGGRIVILIDDGLATGATMRAAAAAARRQKPARIVVAVPTGAAEACAALRREADEVVCALSPEPFFSVGHSYLDFAQNTDDEVRTLLARAWGA